jgi:hypothetical protein
VKTIEAIYAFQTVQKLINEETPKTVQFSYALIKNRRTLEAIVQRYNTAIADAYDPDLERLLAAWREIAPAYAQMNGDQPVLDQNGNIVIAIEHVTEYNLVCEKIILTNDEYRHAFDKRNKLVQTLQNAESTAAIHPIPLSFFPPGMDFQTVEGLYGLIDGDQ